MERLDVLIRAARDQTGNQLYTATQGIPQREFVRYANDGQMRIYNKLLQERSSLYTKESFISLVAGQAAYTLPTDVFLKHNPHFQYRCFVDDDDNDFSRHLEDVKKEIQIL